MKVRRKSNAASLAATSSRTCRVGQASCLSHSEKYQWAGWKPACAFMHWIAASLVSALFLGVYELCTKHACGTTPLCRCCFQHPDRRAGVGWLVTGADASSGHAAGVVGHGSVTPVQYLQLVLKSAICRGILGFHVFCAQTLAAVAGFAIRATSAL